MAQLLRQGHPPADVMDSVAALDAQRGPYQPCPCGSGQKFRFCHGNKSPSTPFSGVNPRTAVAQAGRASSLHAELVSSATSGGADRATD